MTTREIELSSCFIFFQPSHALYYRGERILRALTKPMLWTVGPGGMFTDLNEALEEAAYYHAGPNKILYDYVPSSHYDAYSYLSNSKENLDKFLETAENRIYILVKRGFVQKRGIIQRGIDLSHVSILAEGNKIIVDGIEVSKWHLKRTKAGGTYTQAELDNWSPIFWNITEAGKSPVMCAVFEGTQKFTPGPSGSDYRIKYKNVFNNMFYVDSGSYLCMSVYSGVTNAHNGIYLDNAQFNGRGGQTYTGCSVGIHVDNGSRGGFHYSTFNNNIVCVRMQNTNLFEAHRITANSPTDPNQIIHDHSKSTVDGDPNRIGGRGVISVQADGVYHFNYVTVNNYKHGKAYIFNNSGGPSISYLGVVTCNGCSQYTLGEYVTKINSQLGKWVDGQTACVVGSPITIK